MDEDDGPSVAQKLKVVALQLFAGSVIVWLVVLVASAGLARVHHECFGSVFSPGTLVGGILLVGLGYLMTYGPRPLTRFGRGWMRYVGRGWMRYKPGSVLHVATKAEILGGISYGLVAFIVAAELFAVSWFFKASC